MEELAVKLSIACLVVFLVPALGVLANEPTSPASRTGGKKHWEAHLRHPAKLSFGDRSDITVADVIAELRTQHHLSVRFDLPTLSTLLDRRSSYATMPTSGYSLDPAPTPGPYPAELPSRSAFPDRPETGPPYHSGAAAPLRAAIPPIPDSDPWKSPGAASPVSAVSPANVPGTPAVSAGPIPAAPVQTSELYRPGYVLPTASEYGLAVTATGSPPREAPADPMKEILETKVDLKTLDLSQVSLATVLRQTLNSVPVAGQQGFSGMPLLLTEATLLDYLVEDDGILITTRIQALTTRETRVYPIRQLKDIPAEDLARTIRQSIRPWSWRSQINDLGEQLKGTPLPPEALTSILSTGVQLVGGEVGLAVASGTADGVSGASPGATPAVDPVRQMEMLGGMVANGLVTLAQSTILALEMVHHADPPTGTIQVLGSRLIVTQSQAAHREIADLLQALSEE